MVLVRRRTFLAGAVGAAGALALRAAPSEAQSATLKQALLGYEDGVAWAAHQVAARLIELEAVTQWTAMRPTWRAARAAWLARASTI